MAQQAQDRRIDQFFSGPGARADERRSIRANRARRTLGRPAATETCKRHQTSFRRSDEIIAKSVLERGPALPFDDPALRVRLLSDGPCAAN
jgi:hypothetical protein